MQPIEIAKLLCVLTYIFWCICLQTAKCDISYESELYICKWCGKAPVVVLCMLP
jgi:hypothetical protein